MIDFSLQRSVLPGGLRLILVPRRERQTVAFLVMIGVGSRYETPAQSGLSHFLEHMFFKGTETRKSSQAIAEAIEGVGGAFNAFTGEEYTGYYVKVAAEHLPRAAEVVSDILLRPLFAPEEIERERGVIQEEIRMYTETPMRHIHHLWQKALFGSHPLGRRIDGTAETVNHFRQQHFLNYVRQHYHTENTVVAVAGCFQSAEAMAAVQRLLAPLPQGQETFPRVAPTVLPKHRLVHEYRKSLEQTHLMVGVPGVSLHDERHWAAELLAIILGGGMSSRLFLSVRERHGLAYAIRTSADSYTDTGSLVTQAGVRLDQGPKALQLIQAEYDRVTEEKVTQPELEKAKQIFNGHLMLELEETNSLALYVTGQELLTKKVLTPEQIKHKVAAVTADEIITVAQTLFDRKRRAAALLSPHRSLTAFERLLK